MNPDPFLRHTFWTVNTGTAFTLIIYLGIHPGAIQRFVALPTYSKARKALIYFGIGLIIVKVLTGTVGMLIFATYKDCDPVSAKVSKLFFFIIFNNQN
jgi:sodium-coupled monocarboxylate transporter 8/12